MKLSTILLLLVLIVTAVFAFLNWHTFVTPTDLSLGFVTVQLPLGLVMLAIVVLLTIVFLAYVVYLQSSALLETRRHSKQLQANRELADQAEASRFTELRGFIATEMAKLDSKNPEATSAVLARIDLVEKNLDTAIEQAGNTLAAYIGELEDRLEKK